MIEFQRMSFQEVVAYTHENEERLYGAGKVGAALRSVHSSPEQIAAAYPTESELSRRRWGPEGPPRHRMVLLPDSDYVPGWGYMGCTRTEFQLEDRSPKSTVVDHGCGFVDSQIRRSPLGDWLFLEHEPYRPGSDPIRRLAAAQDAYDEALPPDLQKYGRFNQTRAREPSVEPRKISPGDLCNTRWCCSIL
jgi:hypothetical protein